MPEREDSIILTFIPARVASKQTPRPQSETHRYLGPERSTNRRKGPAEDKETEQQDREENAKKKWFKATAVHMLSKTYTSK
jgi:hypothetical protein